MNTRSIVSLSAVRIIQFILPVENTNNTLITLVVVFWVSSRYANFYKKYIQGMPTCKIQ